MSIQDTQMAQDYTDRKQLIIMVKNVIGVGAQRKLRFIILTETEKTII